MTIKPEKITIEIGNLCNLKCEMCFLAGLKRKSNVEAKKFNSFLPLDLFRNIIDEVVDKFITVDIRRPFSINLSGGEAFLHPEIFAMLSYLRERNIESSIFTNGTLIDAGIAEKIINTEPGAMMFSLDGPEEIHDKIRGKGNFKKTFDAIRLIQEEKTKRDALKPKILVNFLINNLNVGHLEEFIILCKKLKINVLFFSHIKWSNPEITEKISEEFRLRLGWTGPLSEMAGSMEHNLYVREEKIKNLIEEIKKIKSAYLKDNSLRIVFLPDISPKEISLWYSQGSYRIDSCNAYKNWIRIGANGDVYPICVLMPYPFGNLKENSLEEILNSEKAEKFFTAIEKDGLFYVCQRCCRRHSKSIIS